MTKEELSVVTNDLLEKIHYYYPVGYVQFASRYRGYQEIRSIMNKKIDVDCNNPDSLSNQSYKSLRKVLTNVNLHNNNHYNFPNYVISIDCLPPETGFIKLTTTLEVNVSLLCDYYTLYFVDDYRFSGEPYQCSDLVETPRYSVVSYESSLHRFPNEYLQNLKDCLAKFFSSKKYVSHHYLFEQKVGGVSPFPMPEESFGYTSASFFELLFFGKLKPCDYRFVK